MLKLKASDKVVDSRPEEDEALAWGDVTGADLDFKEVMKARMKELQYIDGKEQTLTG